MGFWHCALYLAVIGLASSAAALLPRRWFHADRFPFRPQRWEHEGKIYEKLAVQRWKDKLPDMSRFLPWLTQKQVSASISAAQAERLVQETCVAELVHDTAILERGKVIDRHRREWAAPRKLIYDGVKTRDFDLCKIAKWTAETLQVIQNAERRAWGLDQPAEADSKNTVVVIERE